MDTNTSSEFSVYAKDTGAIRLSGRAQRSCIPAHAQADEAVVFKWLVGATQYVDTASLPPRVKDRPIIPPFDKLAIKADATDAATTTLPVAMTVNIDGIDTECPAGPLPFKADSPGTYVVTIRCFPYQDFTATIVAS